MSSDTFLVEFLGHCRYGKQEIYLENQYFIQFPPFL